MSELIQKNDNRATIRWKLLTGASVLALTAYAFSAVLANAEDGSQPQVWIELGGQLSRLDDSQEVFSPSIFSNRPALFSPSQAFEKPPLYSIDEFAALTFEPQDSNWVFSASVRYGRSVSKRHVHQQTYPLPTHKYFGSRIYTIAPPYVARFADTRSRVSESHSILDFRAGKDVGIGMFHESDATSVFSLGVRFAQFRSRSNVALRSDPEVYPLYKYYGTVKVARSGVHYRSNAAMLAASRSFNGIGPSISWDASLPVVGNSANGELLIDWGVNAALLFGRQKANVHRQTTAWYHKGNYNIRTNAVRALYQHNTPIPPRSRSVTVPNIGGMAGISYRMGDAKLSFGYKADFFFNAIDGGIDARKEENRGFNGPYASISVGLGD